MQAGCSIDVRNNKAKSLASKLAAAVKPVDPTQLAVTAKSPSRISLAWADNTVGETSYELERCAGLGCASFTPVAGISPLPANSVAADDATISPSTYYSYRVRAVSAKTNSAWLARADIPPAATRLVFATAPSASATAGSVLAAQPVLQAYDAATDPDPDYATAVTLAAFTDAACLTAAGGVLSGNAATVTAGVASFTGVKFSAAATIYLGATSGTLAPACSGAVTVAGVLVDHLAFTGQPSATNTAGVAFGTSPTVVAQDVSNGTATGYSSSVTIAAFTDVGCLTAAAGTLANGALAATSGVIAYANVSFTKSGTYYLKATAAGLTGACSSAFVVSPDAVTQLAFTTAPSAINTAASNFSGQPIVAARDAYANLNPGYSSGVTLSAFTDVGCLTAAAGSLTGAVAAPSGGISTYTAVNYGQSGTIYLKALSGAVASPCVGAIAVAANSATQLVFTTAPSGTNTAGANLAGQPVVAAQDGNGVTYAGYVSGVTLSAYADAGCLTVASGTLNGAAIAPTGGVSTFTGLNYTGVGTVYLKAGSGAIASSCSGALTFVAGAVSQLAFTIAPPSNAVVNVNFAPQPVLTAQDANGNTVPGYSTAITLSKFTDAGCTTAAGGTLSGPASATTSAGVASFSGVQYDAIATIYLKASDGTRSKCSSAVAVAAGGIHHLAFTTPPSATGSAGVNLAQQPIVTGQDASGFTVPGYVTSVTLGAYTDVGCLTAAAGTLSGTAGTVGGIATFSGVNFTGIGTIYLKAGDGVRTACSTGVTIAPGAAAKIVIQPVTDSVAGTATTAALQALDAYNNLATAYTGTVTLGATGSATGVGAATFTAGLVSKSVNDLVAQTVTLSLTGPGGLDFTSTRTVTFTPGPPAKVGYATQPDANGFTCESLPQQPVVAIQDQYGNLVPTATNTVSLAAFTDVGCLTAAGGTFTSTATAATAGAAAFSGVKYNLAQNIYIKATSGGLTAQCSNLVTLAQTYRKLGFATAGRPTTGTANVLFSPQPIVEQQDACGTKLTSSFPADTVTVGLFFNSVCTSTAAGTLSVTANGLAPSAGAATFAGVKHTLAGNLYLGVTSATAGVTPACATIAIAPTTANKLVFRSVPRKYFKGVAMLPQVVVAVTDTFGNTVPSASDSITLASYSNSGCTTPSGTLTATTNPKGTTGGVGIWANVKTTSASGTIYLQAASSGGYGTVCSPAIISALPAQIVGNSFSSCSLQANGSVRCWGYNGGNSLGDASGVHKVAPNRVIVSNVVELAGGFYHNCVRKADGTVWCWGYGANGQMGDGTISSSSVAVQVPGIANAVSISSNPVANHSCAGLADGTVKCWGYNYHGQAGDASGANQLSPVTVPMITGAVQVVTGGNHSCALTTDGTIRCWGSGLDGEYGTGELIMKTTEAAPAALYNDYIHVFATGYNTCGVRVGGGLYCWGWGYRGLIGDGGGVQRDTPVAITGVSNVIAMSGGTSHNCAVQANGNLYCWGAGDRGQTGSAAYADSSVPALVSAISGAVSVGAGGLHSCALLMSGSVRCFGDAQYNQLGGSLMLRGSPYRSIPAINTATQASVGLYHGCARLASGSVQCWGYMPYGEAGDGAAYLVPPATVTTAAGITTATKVVAGYYATCAILTGGTLKCWGSWAYSSYLSGSSPVTVSGLGAAVTDVAMSYYGACALLADTTVKCWGYNGSGQLGDNTTTHAQYPVTVTGLTGVTAISASTDAYHYCALITGGTVKCWGYNAYGQLGDGTLSESHVPVAVSGLTTATGIAVGDGQSCAKTSDASKIKCWGYGAAGALGVGDNFSYSTPQPVAGLGALTIGNVIQGTSLGCFTASDNQLRCFGYNNYGAVGDGTFVKRNAPVLVKGVSATPSSVSVGRAAVCIVVSGMVQCWGDDLYFTTNPRASRRYKPMDPNVGDRLVAGTSHSCRIEKDSTVSCWGDNSYGQLGNAGGTSNAPVTIAGFSGADTLAAGATHTCALVADGSAKCWGRNNLGQIGAGAAGGTYTAPQTASNFVATAPYLQITAGDGHTCVLNYSHQVTCWGDNTYGQLGDGTNTATYAPENAYVRDAAGGAVVDNIVSIAAGANHTCASNRAGTVLCWGRNHVGQLGDGTTSNRNYAAPSINPGVAARVVSGGDHTCLVSGDAQGQVMCWGSGTNGQLGQGAYANTGTSAGTWVGTLTDVSLNLATGPDHTCVSANDGTNTYCWGLGTSGQMGNGASSSYNAPSPVVSGMGSLLTTIAVGGGHACTIKPDGTTWSWGIGTSGQLGHSASSSSTTPVNAP